MSSTMETTQLNSEKVSSRLTWRDIAFEKWQKKAKGCPSRGKITSICHAVPSDETCGIDICPFFYWMEGV